MASAAIDQSIQDAGVTVSNQVSYHSAPDLLCDPRVDWAETVGQVLHSCVEAAASEDERHVEMGGGAKRPMALAAWPDSAPHGWLNVARQGVLGLQKLHDHAETSFAAVFHATSGGGALLLRLEPVGDTDLHLHGGSLWLPKSRAKRKRIEDSPKLKYVALVPEAGSVIVFPGWLPHAVGRSDGSTARVSVAANFDLPYCPEPIARPWLVCVRDSRPGRTEEVDEDCEPCQ